MHICDICFDIIEEGDICVECQEREKPSNLKDNGISDEEIIKRFLHLMGLRNRNKEKIIEKLDNMSDKYEVI